MSDQNLQFLEILNSNPKRAWELFYLYARDRLEQCPPGPIRGLEAGRRQECVSRIIEHFVDSDFRVLRTYRSEAGLFGKWFYVVAWRKAISLARSARVEQRETETVTPVTRDHPDLRETVQICFACLMQMDQKCRVLLKYASEEYTPSEIVAALGLNKDQNVQISESIRQCRKKLKALVEARGVSISDYFRKSDLRVSESA